MNLNPSRIVIAASVLVMGVRVRVFSNPMENGSSNTRTGFFVKNLQRSPLLWPKKGLRYPQSDVQYEKFGTPVLEQVPCPKLTWNAN